MANLRRVLLFAAAFVALENISLAQFCHVVNPPVEWQATVGFSPDSPTWIGTAPNRKLFVAGIGYNYRCWSVGQVNVDFSVSLLPVAMVFQPDQFLIDRTTGRLVFSPKHAVYGLGVMPVGFILTPKKQTRVQPFLDTHGGIIASTDPIPYDESDATGLNFIFDAGGGIKWKIRPREAMAFGYKFLHVSNGFTTRLNPGLDNNLFTASFLLQR
jgi:Lipid A 3-O-deacylase (PagL)